jgi:hypothetical protein
MRTKTHNAGIAIGVLTGIVFLLPALQIFMTFNGKEVSDVYLFAVVMLIALSPIPLSLLAVDHPGAAAKGMFGISLLIVIAMSYLIVTRTTQHFGDKFRAIGAIALYTAPFLACGILFRIAARATVCVR